MLALKSAARATVFLLACTGAYSACSVLTGPSEPITVTFDGHVTTALGGYPIEGVPVVIAEELESGSWRSSPRARARTGPSGGYFPLSYRLRQRFLETPFCRGSERTARWTADSGAVYVLAVSVDTQGTPWRQVGPSFVARCTEDVQTANFQLCPLSAWNPDSRACVPPAASR
jgi:hypothetical protein